MVKDITFGQYYASKSVLHRLDPRIKLVLCLLMIVFLFVCRSFPALALMVVFTLVAVGFSSVPVKMIAKST